MTCGQASERGLAEALRERKLSDTLSSLRRPSFVDWTVMTRAEEAVAGASKEDGGAKQQREDY